MIRQIESAMELLKKDMKNKNETEKAAVIEKLYMDRSKKEYKYNQRVKVVAEELNCSESSVRRWANEMLTELSVKLFGVDGLRLEL
jgi:Zn-dependent metalloprotease